jgi:hypothetical protein
MPILMDLILGKDNVIIVQDTDGRDYYCAKNVLWERILNQK